MPTKLVIYDVPATKDSRKPSPPKVRETIAMMPTGDAAREEARRYLDGVPGKLRSLNWAPDPGKPDMLVAYMLIGGT